MAGGASGAGASGAGSGASGAGADLEAARSTLDTAARCILQLSDKKWRGRPGEQDRAAGFANFLRCALECIPAEDRENLELKASLIEREAWGGYHVGGATLPDSLQ